MEALRVGHTTAFLMFGKRLLPKEALDALGTVQGYGYDVEPQRARLVAWWSG